MTKTDKSKHAICVASIRRSTMEPYDFKWTKFYESNSDFSYSEFQLNLTEHECIICSTILNADNYSVLTTQRLITKEQGQENSGSIEGATDKLYGDFKDDKDKSYTFGQIQLQNEMYLKYFIETGKASMIMIHGVRTLIRLQQMTSSQVDKVTGIWDKQNDK
jgi:hypothetical protein